VKLCSEATGEEAVKAVDTFLQTCKNKPALLPEGAENGDIITFRVNDEFPVDLPSVQRFWANQTQSGSGNAQMQCLICGNKNKVEERLPLKIKGIPGGQASGTTLISANSEAFESYGLRASLVGPTCRTCAEAFTNSINHMLASESHKLRVGPTAFVFWTKGDSGFSPVSLLSSPVVEEVIVLLDSYRTGKYSDAVVSPDAFYALSLSASGGRAVLRDWLDTTVPRVQANLARWFRLQRLVDSKGIPEKPFGIYALAASLYGEPNDQMVANVPRTLVRCALQGGSLPDWLLVQAVSRNRAERVVTRNRIALIKTILLSQLNHYTEGYMEKIDLSCTSPGYLCGRLLAELEAAQKAAINPRATLVDRYYGAASSAPASVFGNLMRMNRAHMSTLNRDKPGIYIRIDQNLQEILSGLKEFPKTLNLKEQAMFALGYYHQK
ncbi:MAG: type I-C CRISPR-associated protein Cas8c/Csd1, partial [Armatimonadetes bacterium]|nr:type I-C CRISPR-associated protein Cas8c/Csd1 [Armatimonadota bacterium]